MNYYELQKLSELELVKKIKYSSSKEEYNVACTVIINKYKNLVNKQWTLLCSQLSNTSWADKYKNDFYSLSYEAVIKAISKIDLTKVKENFLIVQMASWYVGNVRTELIKKIIKVESKLEPIIKIKANHTDDESNYFVDPAVEKAYSNSIGYMESPEYKLLETLGEENCEKSINTCLKKWSYTEQTIFKYLSYGKSKIEISKLMNIPKSKVYYLSNKMKKELSAELDKDKVEDTYLYLCYEYV